MLDHQPEFVHFASADGNAFYLACGVINTHEDRAALRVHEGYYCLKEYFLKEGAFDGEVVVLELDGHALERETLAEEEVPFAAETGVLDGDWF